MPPFARFAHTSGVVWMHLCCYQAKAGRWGPKQMASLGMSLRGLKNKGADLVRAGEVSGDVGKKALPLPEYRELAKITLQLGPAGRVGSQQVAGLTDCRHLTALHLFVLFAWNLCMRADSVSAIHSKHLDWDNDSLAVGVNKSKRHDDEEFEYFKVYALQPRVLVQAALHLRRGCHPGL